MNEVNQCESVDMNFGSADDFVADMMEHEGTIYSDSYGRHWKYDRFKFYFKDLGEIDWVERISCLHLYGTNITRAG